VGVGVWQSDQDQPAHGECQRKGRGVDVIMVVLHSHTSSAFPRNPLSHKSKLEKQLFSAP